MLRKKYILYVLLVTFGFVAGVLAKHLFYIKRRMASADQQPIREGRHNFKFINPLLVVGDRAALRRANIEQPIQASVEQSKEAGLATSISVYFRDLESGEWAGVNESEKYAPASMYKVAILIAYLKEAGTNPNLLSSTIEYRGAVPLKYGNESDTSPYPIEKGKEYLIDDLLGRMIIYSDNNAKDLLYDALNKDTLKGVFTDLGLGTIDENNPGDTMSAKSFSLFFRVLYNASYLTRGFSEVALSLLARTTFDGGLEAGVPQTVVVADKFGYRAVEQGVPEEELHDCGIIYYPNHPYLLCIMTRGKTTLDLAKAIQDISRVAYQERAAEFKH